MLVSAPIGQREEWLQKDFNAESAKQKAATGTLNHRWKMIDTDLTGRNGVNEGGTGRKHSSLDLTAELTAENAEQKVATGALYHGWTGWTRILQEATEPTEESTARPAGIKRDPIEEARWNFAAG